MFGGSFCSGWKFMPRWDSLPPNCEVLMILNLKRRSPIFSVALILIAAHAPALPGRQQTLLSLLSKPEWNLLSVESRSEGASQAPRPLYETRAIHDQDGIGKFYMGREIAQVMGPGGIPWLDRPEREDQEKSSRLLDALELRDGETVVDLGAGSGYFAFRIAPRVGRAGKVLAVEIQDEMLQKIRERAQALKLMNVEAVKGSETDPKLPVRGVDLVLMVDVYHELAYPFEVMTKVREALKPGGRVFVVEYRKEDPAVRIKEVHKMSVEQVKREMNAVGLVHVQTLETLPLQHIVIFKKPNQPKAAGKIDLPILTNNL
jgi:ubiquinone/menaquinone biosynthesis C-methylase UbiE